MREKNYTTITTHGFYSQVYDGLTSSSPITASKLSKTEWKINQNTDG